MKLIFNGAEVGSNRTLLEGMNIEWMGINYYHLRKRGLPKTKNWLISEHFPESVNVVIESGAAQADKDGLSKEELTSLGLRAAFSIAQGPGSLRDALLDTEKNLGLTAFNIAQMMK